MGKQKVIKLIVVSLMLITAIFSLSSCQSSNIPITYTYTYTYHYNYATENNTTKSIELKHEDLEQATLIVPKREYCNFEGWYLDDNFTTQVSDKQGNLVIGREIFDNESRSVYAKWSAINEITYKILMAYVTEVKATLVTLDGVSVNVDYKMSQIERKICEATTVQFEARLNKVFSGLIFYNRYYRGRKYRRS